ncbi:MAG: uroporphyrinogen-III C-methyltransferase, partial [Magnetospirillum sp.]|nr:uroporphyrinogen-III C-methyltransferase [Magnetospirillum sp.]
FDWDGLARGAQVLVFYMALRQLDKVVERLMAAGRKPHEPVAIVSKAATPRQKVLESTLSTIVADLAAQPMEPPAMLVVGGVVALRAQLDWWNPG